jgi:GNAT superfamily N-acetyltransferase
MEGYCSPYNDQFEYRSILDFPIEEIHRLMIPFLDDISAPDPLARAGTDFSWLIEHAGTAFDPEYWYVASLNSDPAGVVYPQLLEDRRWDDGSIWHIGVLTEFRGRGYGKILHARGLETLRALGAKKNVGSTEVENSRMLRVFQANDCNILFARFIQEFDNGCGRELD